MRTNKLLMTMLLLVAGTAVGRAQTGDQNISIDDIINSESKAQVLKDRDKHLQSVWGKRSYFNISYVNTTLESDQWPSAADAFPGKMDNKMGVGLKYGTSHYFHKKPIGDMLFIGLDFNGLDLMFNQYKGTDEPLAYAMGDRKPYSMPWHHKKWSADYGMSLGPSLTLFPFAPIKLESTDKIRLHLYYHFGYTFGVTQISDTQMPTETGSKTSYVLGHGISSTFGFDLTWQFIGIGYEHCNWSKLRNHNIPDTDFGKHVTETERSCNRFFLQFRL